MNFIVPIVLGIILIFILFMWNVEKFTYCKSSLVPETYYKEKISLEDAQKLCETDTTCKGVVTNLTNTESALVKRSQTTLTKTSENAFWFKKDDKCEPNYYCFHENLLPSNNDYSYTKAGYSIQEAVNLCEVDNECQGFVVEKDNQGYVFSFVPADAKLKYSSTQPKKATFIKNQEPCKVKSSMSPLGSNQISKFLKSNTYFNEPTDAFPYYEDLKDEDKIFFSPINTTCSSLTDTQCYVNSKTVDDLSLPTETYSKNRGYYLDDTYNYWKVKGDYCATNAPYIHISENEGVKLKEPCESDCDNVCEKIDKNKGFYRKDLNSCVKDFCKNPTQESCDDNDFIGKCPKACNERKPECNKQGGFLYFFKHPFIYETDDIYNQFYRKYAVWLNQKYDFNQEKNYLESFKEAFFADTKIATKSKPFNIYTMRRLNSDGVLEFSKKMEYSQKGTRDYGTPNKTVTIAGFKNNEFSVTDGSRSYKLFFFPTRLHLEQWIQKTV
jgi:hypothetical protein